MKSLRLLSLSWLKSYILHYLQTRRCSVMVQQQSKLCENYAAPDYKELKAVFPFSYIEML